MELAIFEVIERIGIPAFSLVALFVIVFFGLRVFNTWLKDRAALEKLKLTNDREVGIQNAEAIGAISLTNKEINATLKDFGALVKTLTEQVGVINATQADNLKLLEKLKGQNGDVIKATQSAQEHLSAKLDNTQKTLEGSIREQADRFAELVGSVVENLMKQYHTTQSNEQRELLNKELHSVVSLFQMRINELENKIIQLFNERQAQHEKPSSSDDIGADADVSPLDTDAPPSASDGDNADSASRNGGDE